MSFLIETEADRGMLPHLAVTSVVMRVIFAFRGLLADLLARVMRVPFVVLTGGRNENESDQADKQAFGVHLVGNIKLKETTSALNDWESHARINHWDE